MSLGLVVTSVTPAGTAAGNPAAEARPSSLSDKQLLARFFQRREDAAFAALVERHGPLVYRVCRRVLSDTNDADDAFQATFLVLVRKGASLKQPERLASWLYGVASRTAQKLKVRAAVRSKYEREAGDMPTTSNPENSKVENLTLHELRVILDEEIGKMPEKYSLPLTLCYLEGKTNAQAATQLGWPEGSISRRLSKARELLRSRLARRGLALSVALMASVFAQPLKACPPPGLIEATTSAGCMLLRGVPIGEVASSQAAAAVGYAVTGMASLAKVATSISLAVGSIGLAIVVGVCQFASEYGPMGPVEAFYYLTSPENPDDGSDCAPPAGACIPGSAAEAVKSYYPIPSTPANALGLRRAPFSLGASFLGCK
jgi:RNA polymerase sigma factor (sigma-70 family)